MGQPEFGTHALASKSSGSRGRHIPVQWLLVPPSWRSRDMWRAISTPSKSNGRPETSPSASDWVSASQSSPPLSRTITDDPDPIRSRARVSPAGPAPMMQMSAVRTDPSGTSLASWITGPALRPATAGQLRGMGHEYRRLRLGQEPAPTHDRAALGQVPSHLGGDGRQRGLRRGLVGQRARHAGWERGRQAIAVGTLGQRAAEGEERRLLPVLPARAGRHRDAERTRRDQRTDDAEAGPHEPPSGEAGRGRMFHDRGVHAGIVAVGPEGAAPPGAGPQPPDRERRTCLATLVFIDQRVDAPLLVTWRTTLPPVSDSTLPRPSTMAFEVTSVAL